MLDEKQLVKLLRGVKDNKLEDLEELQREFFYFLKKYSDKFQVDIQMLQDEFNLIILKIIEIELKEKFKILAYIKKSILNFKDKDKDKLLRQDAEIKFISIDDIEYISLNEKALIQEVDLLAEVDKFTFLNNLDEKTIRILKEKYLDGYTCEELGIKYNMSKQGISKKIKVAKSKINKNYNII